MKTNSAEGYVDLRRLESISASSDENAERSTFVSFVISGVVSIVATALFC